MPQRYVKPLATHRAGDTPCFIIGLGIFNFLCENPFSANRFAVRWGGGRPASMSNFLGALAFQFWLPLSSFHLTKISMLLKISWDV
jgi:hypothetical protein